ncbi:MAG: hypothetical protein ACHQT9_03435 [Candidatus Saccharimonadales bacterium]
MSEEKQVEEPVQKPASPKDQPKPGDKEAKKEPEIITEPEGTEPQNKDDKEKQKAFESFSKKKGEMDSMSVKVYSPSRVYFNGQAFSVSATNATGEFDVLPQHHRFISLLDECDLIIRTASEGNRKISISGGLMHVKEDRLVVFLDI